MRYIIEKSHLISFLRGYLEEANDPLAGLERVIDSFLMVGGRRLGDFGMEPETIVDHVGTDIERLSTPPDTSETLKAWELYCEETKGDMDVRDSWFQLSPRMQRYYMSRVRETPVPAPEPTRSEFLAPCSHSWVWATADHCNVCSKCGAVR